MSKPELNIEDNIMSQIKNRQLKIKPKWYFLFGSLSLFGGFIGLAIMSTFFVSLLTFYFRTHGPMGIIRHEQLISSFPWWSLIIAVMGISFGTYLLRKFDFSYKSNFVLMVVVFVFAVIISGWLVNYLGLDNLWNRRGPIRNLYQKYDGGIVNVRGLGPRGMGNLIE